MASFFDNLPPSNLDLEIKIALYLGLVYIFLTAFTTWFINRGRKSATSSPKKEKKPKRSEEPKERQVFKFDNKNDQLQNLRIEKIGLDASMSLLKTVSGSKDISSDAFNTLSKFYGKRLHEINLLLTQVEPAKSSSSIPAAPSTSATDLSPDEMDDIEADLQKQLEDLERDDDFLKPSSSRAPTAPVAPVSAAEPEFTPMGSAAIPAPPSKPQAPATPQPTAAPSAAIPPPPGKPKKPSASAKQQAPAAPQPPSSGVASPVASPVAVKTEGEDEQIFAKSTSIAALRMDMLRELARLKKLINEDE